MTTNLESIRARCEAARTRAEKYLSGEWTTPTDARHCAEDALDALSEIDRLTAELATYEASSISCCECGGKVVEFTVPNDIWNMVMRPDGKETNREYICLDCWYKALKNKLDELAKNVQEEFDIGSGYYKKWQKAEAQLATLKEAQRWIPVTEKEPPESGEYIVCEKRLGVRVAYEDEWRAIDWDVTHWMPLPAQPENEALSKTEIEAIQEPTRLWIVDLWGEMESHYELMNWETVCACPLEKRLHCISLDGGDDFITLDNYADTWLAYRRKPERSEG
jgi:hypothetical protein